MRTERTMIENKSELALLDLMRALVAGNHASAEDVTVVKHGTSETKLRHLSEWRFYADASSVKINVGDKAPSGSVAVDAKEFESERDRCIREFSNSQNMLEIAFEKLNVSYEKGKEISDIGTFRERAVTATVCLSCIKACPECKGKKKVKCSSCRGSGKKTCPHCNGRGSFAYSVPAKDGSIFGGTTEYHTCLDCHGSGDVRCSRCSGKKKVKCRKCNGTGIMTHYLTVTGYADSNGKCSVPELESTEEGRLLNQYISGKGNFEKFVKYADFSFAGKSFPEPDIALLEYSGTVETADLTFSVKGHDKEYRVLSFGTPAELFMTCNLYDDLFAEEIEYIKSQPETQTGKEFFKNELEKLEKFPAFQRAFAYIAAHKKSIDDPNAGQYFSDSCSGCISDESARILGLYLSRILNSISATRNKLFTLISFFAVFAVFAADDEHFFEMNYTGNISDILPRYFLDLAKAILIFFGLMFVNSVILDLKNISVKKEYRQACKEYYLMTYMFLLHVCVAVSFTYGILAHKGDVPAVGNAPYSLKKEYVDPYITDPAGKAWDKTLDLGYSYVLVPIKKSIEFYGSFLRKPEPKSAKEPKSTEAKDKSGNRNSQPANSWRNKNRNQKSKDSKKKNNQK